MQEERRTGSDSQPQRGDSNRPQPNTVETARVTGSDCDTKVSNTDELLAGQGFLKTCSALDSHNHMGDFLRLKMMQKFQ